MFQQFFFRWNYLCTHFYQSRKTEKGQRANSGEKKGNKQKLHVNVKMIYCCCSAMGMRSQYHNDQTLLSLDELKRQWIKHHSQVGKIGIFHFLISPHFVLQPSVKIAYLCRWTRIVFIPCLFFLLTTTHRKASVNPLAAPSLSLLAGPSVTKYMHY